MHWVVARWAFVFFAFCGAAGVLGATARAADAAAAPGRRPPNVLLILADDQGWRDTGYTGSDYYETPNLDRLAREGMAFTNAYAGAGNCAPSRACLLSGLYGPRHGVYAVGDTDRGPPNKFRLVPVPNKHGLAGSYVTVAEAMRAAGYATGIFGKWHLSGKDGASQAEQGFDAVFDAGTTGRPRIGNDPKGAFSITDRAAAFMEANRDKPFFCYVPHHAIHGPLEAREASLAKFKAKPAGKQHDNALYAACLYDFDEAVGRLLKKLADLKLDRDTLVVFTSDNGGTPKSSQEPLRGNKGCYYEGGIREPMIVRWPGVVVAGSTCDVPVVNLDFYPTFLAAAGAKPAPGQMLDGESLLPLFKGGKSLQRPAIFWHFPGYLDVPVTRGRDPLFRTRPVTAMRAGDYKVLLYHEEWQLDGGRAKVATNNAVEVYNLATDAGERINLARTDPKKREELLDLLLDWMKKADAKMPDQPNVKYDPTGKPKPGKKANGKLDDGD